MLKPVNNHILIEPLKHDSFIASEKGMYEEIGIVLSIAPGFSSGIIQVGDKVYFDSWLAAKYPKNDREWYWLVRYEDVRAIDDGKD